MSDKESLLALLERFGITPAPIESDDPDERENIVLLDAKEGGVQGYSGFFCEFHFNADGSFDYVELASD